MSHPRHPLALVALAATVLTVAAAHAGDAAAALPPYEIGQGLSFPDQQLDLGGYLSLQYDNLSGQEAVFSVPDLSLFVGKRLNARWSLFTELEVGDALQVDTDGQVAHNQEFDVERLYAEYRASPAVNLRFGKFLTPVGRWNMVHADPLVWTVSRPLTATAAFPRHAVGMMAYGSIPAAGHDLDYWAFVDDTAALDPWETDEPAFDLPGSSVTVSNVFDKAAGGRLLYHLFDDHLSLGASYVYFESREETQDMNLLGLDFFWEGPYLELSGEAVYRTTDGWSQSDERGGFVQLAVPLPHQWWLIGRYERYQADVLDADPRLNTLGLTYRPIPPVSFKLEYRTGSDNDAVAPDGWLASMAVLF